MIIIKLIKTILQLLLVPIIIPIIIIIVCIYFLLTGSTISKKKITSLEIRKLLKDSLLPLINKELGIENNPILESDICFSSEEGRKFKTSMGKDCQTHGHYSRRYDKRCNRKHISFETDMFTPIVVYLKGSSISEIAEYLAHECRHSWQWVDSKDPALMEEPKENATWEEYRRSASEEDAFSFGEGFAKKYQKEIFILACKIKWMR